MAIEAVAVLLLGIAIGIAAGWLLRSSRTHNRLEQALEELRVESTRRASFEALAQRVPELEQSLQYREQMVARQQQTILEGAREKESLAATIEAERKAFAEKLKLLEEVKSGALRSNSEEFLKLAQASVAPIQEALGKFDSKIQALEVAREGAYQGLLQQVSQLLDTGRQLRSETSNLVQALRSPVTRGQWGEIQLKRVVEMAGMLAYCDFVEQETLRTEAGSLRPDLVVKLPAGKTIVVDAKAPVASYMDAMALEDEAQRKAKLQGFAKLVRERVAELGRKSYWDQFEHTPELVVMFLPGDHFYSAALEQDPSLIEFGVDQKVLVATPVTLIGLLRAIAYGWRQEAIAANAQEISELGAELYKRIADLGGHWIDIGRNLAKTVDAFNGAVGSLETRVLVSARRFKDLGAAPASVDIEIIEPVVKGARSLKVLDIGTAKDG